jgi:hypothetical protein
MHVDAEDMRNLLSARAAKSAELPERPRRRRSPVCDHARMGEDVPAARKRRLTTSGMSACASEVAEKQTQGAVSGQRAASQQ